MHAHTGLLLLCVLTGAFAQSYVRGRNYKTIPANNDIYYGDLAHIQWSNGIMFPICRRLDRDFTIDLMVYDRITVKRGGTYAATTGRVSGIGVEFQELSKNERSFRTILVLVFPGEQELVQYLPL
ncbi:uncharacterized protein LOC117324292 [Pecten maximus]|uniref:uncharacterized protein LOC117324292 n=1 Tax=Pecten maximus TaxID=6579 RepID=UPI001458CDB1|nr:uncharacterized protein LOC117324292 [Pecten maximus]